MSSRKQPRDARVAAPEPIVVDILRLGDLRPPREHQFILHAVLWIPGPDGEDDEPDAAVGGEAAGGGWRFAAAAAAISLGGDDWGAWFGGGVVVAVVVAVRGVAGSVVMEEEVGGSSRAGGFLASFGALFPTPVAFAELRGWNCVGAGDGVVGWGGG